MQFYRVFFICVPGFPEIGLHAKLQADQTITTKGWHKITGFKVDLDSTYKPTDNGPYDIDSNLQADLATIVIPITGIYLISVSVPIEVDTNSIEVRNYVC